ncbi:hypothetical protein PR003_g23999 [Phytophthora rubi]|uniref:Secreted protein n=1 Tax=Phytophthora rubi TaxID=129364 RepID=A0A6A4CUX6_9STRA|nr:hypothetical protein PR002_g23241 [Phytophthora rubi]KAE8986234.1 hypothetical protein PR001_g22656 [Phytophthora rubi]KAE9295505.1 hypothetical protein PR003_g23999 [Phytophthora rubi]
MSSLFTCTAVVTVLLGRYLCGSLELSSRAGRQPRRCRDLPPRCRRNTPMWSPSAARLCCIRTCPVLATVSLPR